MELAVAEASGLGYLQPTSTAGSPLTPALAREGRGENIKPGIFCR